MSDKDFQILMDFTEEELKRVYTKEEALLALRDAGILDEKGNFTKPYKNLGRYIQSRQYSQ